MERDHQRFIIAYISAEISAYDAQRAPPESDEKGPKYDFDRVIFRSPQSEKGCKYSDFDWSLISMEVQDIHNIDTYDFNKGLARFFADNKDYLDFDLSLDCIVRLPPHILHFYPLANINPL